MFHFVGKLTFCWTKATVVSVFNTDFSDSHLWPLTTNCWMIYEGALLLFCFCIFNKNSISYLLVSLYAKGWEWFTHGYCGPVCLTSPVQYFRGLLCLPKPVFLFWSVEVFTIMKLKRALCRKHLRLSNTDALGWYVGWPLTEIMRLGNHLCYTFNGSSRGMRVIINQPTVFFKSSKTLELISLTLPLAASEHSGTIHSLWGKGTSL